MNYLLKTEPTAYSFADLVREKETDWTGVTNPQAVKNLSAMKKGDKLVIYHTGDEKTAVGLAQVSLSIYPTPKFRWFASLPARRSSGRKPWRKSSSSRSFRILRWSASHGFPSCRWTRRSTTGSYTTEL